MGPKPCSSPFCHVKQHKLREYILHSYLLDYGLNFKLCRGWEFYQKAGIVDSEFRRAPQISQGYICTHPSAHSSTAPWFRYVCIFTPNIGKLSHFDAYFSDGLTSPKFPGDRPAINEIQFPPVLYGCFLKWWYPQSTPK